MQICTFCILLSYKLSVCSAVVIYVQELATLVITNCSQPEYGLDELLWSYLIIKVKRTRQVYLISRHEKLLPDDTANEADLVGKFFSHMRYLFFSFIPQIILKRIRKLLLVA